MSLGEPTACKLVGARLVERRRLQGRPAFVKGREATGQLDPPAVDERERRDAAVPGGQVDHDVPAPGLARDDRRTVAGEAQQLDQLQPGRWRTARWCSRRRAAPSDRGRVGRRPRPHDRPPRAERQHRPRCGHWRRDRAPAGRVDVRRQFCAGRAAAHRGAGPRRRTPSWPDHRPDLTDARVHHRAAGAVANVIELGDVDTEAAQGRHHHRWTGPAARRRRS